MDWQVAAGDFFVAAAVVSLVAAPLVGSALRIRRAAFIAGTLAILSFAFLAFCWRGIAGGPLAALAGHAALIISVTALAGIGRAARAFFSDRVAAAMASLVVSVLVVAGIFAMAPLTANLSPAATKWLLFANPLVSVTSAAGIDLLHIDTIYRTSPLAHRGVVLPAWTTACAVYAAAGLAMFGAARIRPRSHQS